MNKKSHLSGKVFIDNGFVYWEVQNNIVLDLPIKEIKFIGEYTTSNGPFIDDWYLVLYCKNFFKEISMYADGMDKTLSFLSSHYNFDIKTNLANSSTFNTRILYPSELLGAPFWEIKIKESNTLLGKIKKALGFKNKEILQTDLVNNFLK